MMRRIRGPKNAAPDDLARNLLPGSAFLERTARLAPPFLQRNFKLRHNRENDGIDAMTSKARTPAVAVKHDSAPFDAGTRARAENRLRQMSVRITAARVNVLAALIDAPCAYSHHDMQGTFADMDRVTLYRALDCLTAAGLVHRIAGDDRVFRYSAGTEQAESAHAPERHRHGHFKCTRCSKVYCLDGGDADWPADAAAPGALRQPTLPQQLQAVLHGTLGKGFRGHDIELTIKGWCADCAH
jgi:Fur family ferric uptake transcriptional regulator